MVNSINRSVNGVHRYYLVGQPDNSTQVWRQEVNRCTLAGKTDYIPLGESCEGYWLTDASCDRLFQLFKDVRDLFLSKAKNRICNIRQFNEAWRGLLSLSEQDISHFDSFGFPTNLSFRRQLTSYLDKSIRDGSKVTWAFLDLDNLRKCNSLTSHQITDLIVLPSIIEFYKVFAGLDLSRPYRGDEMYCGFLGSPELVTNMLKRVLDVSPYFPEVLKDPENWCVFSRFFDYAYEAEREKKEVLEKVVNFFEQNPLSCSIGTVTLKPSGSLPQDLDERGLHYLVNKFEAAVIEATKIAKSSSHNSIWSLLNNLLSKIGIQNFSDKDRLLHFCLDLQHKDGSFQITDSPDEAPVIVLGESHKIPFTRRAEKTSQLLLAG